MAFLHGHATAPATNILHRFQFVFAHMLRFNFRRTAEGTFSGIPTGVAEVTGLLGDGTAAFACIGHNDLLSVK